MLSNIEALDSPSFDPIAYINQCFPTEASLDELDTVVVGIGSKISILDDEISKAVQGQSRAGEQASRDILEAQNAITELFEKIGDIKTKASQSEKMVQEICADIKKLDCAKTHLQSTITSLKRLQMLITAVGQLELMASEYQYREAANLLEAVKQLMTHFEKYTAIPKIAEIKLRVDTIQSSLQNHVFRSFKEIGQLVETVAEADAFAENFNLRSLSDACLVVDALGPATRQALLLEFTESQLAPYETLFGPQSDHFTLDEVDRRWAWIKRLVRSVDSKFASVCPPHWGVSQRLCLHFNEKTRRHLVTMLTELGDDIDVTALLKALQSALKFEHDMRTHFEEEYRKFKEAEANAAANKPPPSSSDTLLPAVAPPVEVSSAEKSTIEQIMMPGCVSSLFDDFLQPYVLLERRNFDEMLVKLSYEDVSSNNEGGTSSITVYNSAMHMFAYIKNSIKRCVQLTTGVTFLNLSKEFRAGLAKYAETLKQHCPTSHRLPPNAEVQLCYTINTAEYCTEVLPQLETMIKTKINLNLQNNVSFANEVEVYMDLIAHCISVLVNGIMEKCDPAFRTMANTNWSTVTSVGEESAYLRQWHTVYHDMIVSIREVLSTSYFRNVCTKLASLMLQRYLEVIMKQKRISETGTQQLLLDTYNLKTMLLHLHHMGMSDNHKASSTIPAMYMKLVTTQTTHIEMILKLVGTPSEMLLERFTLMWPEGTAADLQSIMSLQGLKKQEQQAYLETFGLVHSNARRTSSGDKTKPPKLTSNLPVPPISAPSMVGSNLSVNAMANSMRSLTQDLSSSARNAVGDIRNKLSRVIDD